MADPSSTLELSGSSVSAARQSAGAIPALMIAWSASEPRREGEVALFEGESTARILGRGGPPEGTSGSERVVFHRQRPGLFERMPPLGGPGVSREQLRIRPEGDGLRVERLGKCPMEVRGEKVDTCVLLPGETLVLQGQLVLLCTRRPRKLPPLQSASLASAPSFGEPDAYGIVGESAAAWRLRDQIAWTAGVQQHTLLLGGSGSGKELAARAVHVQSARSRGPFIARNAATIPESLIDAELFGNVKGYPNPGMPERPGLIGAAHGGTLFLDEIGELPQRLQANLLRVLDEGGEYHRLGAPAAQKSDFRVVAATNRQAAELKHDLSARLVLRLEIPGLDERQEDIPFLVRHLLHRAAAKSPDVVRRFFREPVDGAADARVKAGLVEHVLRLRYATNIRELEATLWQAMSASTGDAIDWSGGAVKSGAPVNNQAPAKESVSAKKAGVRKRQRAATDPPEHSADTVRKALDQHAGNMVHAARALGVSRYALYRLLRRHGIEGSEGP